MKTVISHTSSACASFPLAHNARGSRLHAVAHHGEDPTCQRCLTLKYPVGVHYAHYQCRPRRKSFPGCGAEETSRWLDVTCLWCLIPELRDVTHDMVIVDEFYAFSPSDYETIRLDLEREPLDR